MENNTSNAPLVEKIGVLSACLLMSYMIIRHIWSSMKMEKEPIVVLLSGAAGKVSYALVPMICRGITFGSDQPIILHLLDIETEVEALCAVQMELQDSVFPLLKDVVVTTDLIEACKDVNIAIILGGSFAKDYAKAHFEALGQHGSEDCRIVVAANEYSSSSNILKEFSSSSIINNPAAKNITFLTRLDHNRALSIISNKLDVGISEVKNVIIWGDPSSSTTFNRVFAGTTTTITTHKLYPDLNHAIVATTTGPKRIREAEDDNSWLDNNFITAVQQRGNGRKSIAFSTANAISDHIHDWILGTPKGKWVSMGVSSDGSYGIQPGLFYSFPVTCKDGHWNIVQGLEISEFSRKKMDASINC